MVEIYLILFFVGILLVAFAFYRGRGETKKRFSWRSYVSLGLSIALFIALYALPNITEEPFITVIIISILIGSPVAFILSVVALFKKTEKNLLAVFGLFLSLLLVGVVIILGIFVMTPVSP